MPREPDKMLQREMNRWNNRTAMAVTITSYREAAGLTRTQLAERSGVPEELIADLERAQRDALSVGQTEALASALNATWAEIADSARNRAREMREDQ